MSNRKTARVPHLSNLSPLERARLLERAKSANLARATESSGPQLVEVARPRAPPLSLAQQRLWIVSHLEGASGAYHICGAVRIRGHLDGVALRNTLDRLVVRHKKLRTRFVCEDGQPWQVVDAPDRAYQTAPKHFRG